MRQGMDSAGVFRETRRDDNKEYYAHIGMGWFARGGKTHESRQTVRYGGKTVESIKVRRRKR